jgi:hypothetical protein
MNWNFQRTGRAWKGNESMERYELTPEKMEMIKGKLFWSDEDRLNMLGLVLENVGIDKMLDLFEDLSLLKEAIADRERAVS